MWRRWHRRLCAAISRKQLMDYYFVVAYKNVSIENQVLRNRTNPTQNKKHNHFKLTFKFSCHRLIPHCTLKNNNHNKKSSINSHSMSIYQNCVSDEQNSTQIGTISKFTKKNVFFFGTNIFVAYVQIVSRQKFKNPFFCVYFNNNNNMSEGDQARRKKWEWHSHTTHTHLYLNK